MISVYMTLNDNCLEMCERARDVNIARSYDETGEVRSVNDPLLVPNTFHPTSADRQTVTHALEANNHRQCMAFQDFVKKKILSHLIHHLLSPFSHSLRLFRSFHTKTTTTTTVLLLPPQHLPQLSKLICFIIISALVYLCTQRTVFTDFWTLH